MDPRNREDDNSAVRNAESRLFRVGVVTALQASASMAQSLFRLKCDTMMYLTNSC
jgi:hypothetical protein